MPSKPLEINKKVVIAGLLLITPLFALGIFLFWYWNIGDLKIKIAATVLPFVSIFIYILPFLLAFSITSPTKTEIRTSEREYTCASKDDPLRNTEKFKNLPICAEDK
jgi:hypothetical protein